jgi:acyl-CoA reductase-like NAD-dependent aldehyde dehydrogenase
LLAVLDASPAGAQAAIRAGVDKVILTGSAATGEAVQHALAATATPSVMELSGCDAVFVLEGAKLARVVDALMFGLRLNGSATCMAPRRVFVAESLHERLARLLATAMDALGPVEPSEACRNLLRDLMMEATLEGARVLRDGLQVEQEHTCMVRPTLLIGVTPEMRIAQTDVFAPVLSLLSFSTLEQAAAMHEQCPYALTAAIFGPGSGSDKQARALARTITAGTVLFNDVIVSTADPRASFGGRKRSGFGTTRGREGLLAMTAPRMVIRQRGRSLLPYQPTGSAHESFFAGYIQAAHGRGWRARLSGWRAMGRAAPALRPRKH